MKYVKSLERVTPTNQNILELIDFLKEEIHPKYYLIECLEKNVAFHHSKLPDLIRKEIEDLFLNGHITSLFCTSTLIEGVNLPANNLFVVIPKKRTNNLTTFEFGNLIGRAGRIKDSLYGTIYCIERDEDSWTNDYFENDHSKEVVTVTEKVLQNYDQLSGKLLLPVSELKVSGELNTIIF